jgi:tetratricopeptide (TPR) repeat protein
MLFDLRGRGRRRTVQAIYLGLAILIGLGLVGFGVGGGLGGGGLFTALGKEGSGSGIYEKELASAQKRIKADPREAAAWAALAEAKLHQAGNGEYFDQATSKYTSKGLELLHQISEAWNRYLVLNPKNPSSSLANHMVGVYGEEALDEPANAVSALQILIATRPASAQLYASLAKYSYKANNTRQGDLATSKALSLAPASSRPQLKQALEAIKANPTGSSSAGVSGAGAASAGSTSSGTVVTATASATTSSTASHK